MVSSIIILTILLGLMYTMAYWFDKPWKFPLFSMERRKKLAQERIDVIEGTRENWPELTNFRGEWLIDRENAELERLRNFVASA